MQTNAISELVKKKYFYEKRINNKNSTSGAWERSQKAERRGVSPNISYMEGLAFLGNSKSLRKFKIFITKKLI